MNLLKKAHPETHEILNNVRVAYQAGEITREQYNDVVMSCFRAEAESQILGHYTEHKTDETQPEYDWQNRKDMK